MLKSWKSPFKAFGPRGWGPVDGDDGSEAARPASPSVPADASIVRLRNVMAELKVGDAQYDARKGAQTNDERIGVVGPTGAPVEPAAAPSVAAAPENRAPSAAANPPSNGSAAAPSNGAAAASSSNGAASNAAASNGAAAIPRPNGAATIPPSNGTPLPASANGSAPASANGSAPAAPAAGEEALTAAQKLIKEQRKAAEALLLEACMLEERLKGEAQIAQAAGEYAAAREKVAAALRVEQEAKDAARAASEQRTLVATERRDAENAVAAARGDVKTTKSRVAELEQQLRDAKQAGEQAHSMVGLREARVKECLAKEAAAKREGADATARVVAAENARLETEKVAAAVQERVEKIKGGLEGSADLTGMSDVRALAEKIAKQASTMKNGAHTGVVEPETAASR